MTTNFNRENPDEFTRTSSGVYNSINQGIDPSYFVCRKGDNPHDKVFRNGRWISIEEHNQEIMQQSGMVLVATCPAL